jgi:hypothetical protein
MQSGALKLRLFNQVFLADAYPDMQSSKGSRILDAGEDASFRRVRERAAVHSQIGAITFCVAAKVSA